MFSDFCADIGVDSIREYEQDHLKQQTELEKKRYDNHTSVSSVLYVLSLTSKISDERMIKMIVLWDFMRYLSIVNLSVHCILNIFTTIVSPSDGAIQ